MSQWKFAIGDRFRCNGREGEIIDRAEGAAPTYRIRVNGVDADRPKSWIEMHCAAVRSPSTWPGQVHFKFQGNEIIRHKHTKMAGIIEGMTVINGTFSQPSEFTYNVRIQNPMTHSFHTIAVSREECERDWEADGGAIPSIVFNHPSQGYGAYDPGIPQWNPLSMSKKDNEFEKLKEGVQKAIAESFGVRPEQMKSNYSQKDAGCVNHSKHDFKASKAVPGKTKWCSKCDHRE